MIVKAAAAVIVIVKAAVVVIVIATVTAVVRVIEAVLVMGRTSYHIIVIPTNPTTVRHEYTHNSNFDVEWKERRLQTIAADDQILHDG